MILELIGDTTLWDEIMNNEQGIKNSEVWERLQLVMILEFIGNTLVCSRIKNNPARLTSFRRGIGNNE